ncbi:hypothetical protein P7C70_g797, partial [Phenoliferia sp. Uapishka_3]
MTTLLSLPTELLTHVITYLNGPFNLRHGIPNRSRIVTLLSLCLVNHSLRNLAQPFLYSYAKIDKWRKFRPLATSDGFSRFGMRELHLAGAGYPQTGGVGYETAKALIKCAGEKGLRKLTLSGFLDLDVKDLILAGPDLESLDLEAVHVGWDEPFSTEGWRAPFNLTHLGLQYLTRIPNHFLAALLDSSPHLTSLTIGCEGAGQASPPTKSLPALSTIASQITSLALGPHAEYLVTDLSSFSSLSHLTFEHGFDLHSIFEITQTLHSRSPTITRLTLPVSGRQVAASLHLWTDIMGSGGLGNLELITWSKMSEGTVERMSGDLLGGREEVRMEGELGTGDYEDGIGVLR